MKKLGLLVARLVLGGYLGAHGAQKLFGSFGGRGLEGTAAGFEFIGLRPGKMFAAAAGASEFGGGLLTATGIAYPLGPVMIMGTMAVASTTHRKNGPFSTDRGYELPLTNLAAAAALAAAGQPGALRLGPRLSPKLRRFAVVFGVASAGATIYQMLNAPEPEAPAAVPEPEAPAAVPETDASEDETGDEASSDEATEPALAEDAKS
ncbi:MAG: DoxX family protein [Acidimicrobiales bacterium]